MEKENLARIQKLFNQIELYNSKLHTLELKIKYKTKVDALIQLISERNDDLQRIYSISNEEIKMTESLMERKFTFIELFKNDNNPLIIATLAKAKNDEMVCIRDCIQAMRNNEISEHQGEIILSYFNPNKRKLVELKMEYLGSQSIKEKDDDLIARPMKGSTVEMSRIEEKL